MSTLDDCANVTEANKLLVARKQFKQTHAPHLLQLAQLTAIRRVQVLDDVVKGEVLYRRRHCFARLGAQPHHLRGEITNRNVVSKE